MKALFFAGVVVIVAILFTLLGIYIGLAHNSRQALKELGVSKNALRIYRDAMKLLNRMTRITELDGDFAVDILSEKTKSEITEVLDRYREEVNKA